MVLYWGWKKQSEKRCHFLYWSSQWGFRREEWCQREGVGIPESNGMNIITTDSVYVLNSHKQEGAQDIFFFWIKMSFWVPLCFFLRNSLLNNMHTYSVSWVSMMCGFAIAWDWVWGTLCSGLCQEWVCFLPCCPFATEKEVSEHCSSRIFFSSSGEISDHFQDYEGE